MHHYMVFEHADMHLISNECKCKVFPVEMYKERQDLSLNIKQSFASILFFSGLSSIAIFYTSSHQI